ncbi:MAG: 3-phosphoshikimate 1-carboxyvinyltransferase [Thermoleophilia bacterium]
MAGTPEKDGIVKFMPATGGLRGSLAVPADKSISHRAAMIAAICGSPVKIRDFLRAADTMSTLRAIQACGVRVEEGGAGSGLVVHGAGLRGLKPPAGVIDIGNSGTSIRLLPGIFSGQVGTFTLDGDESIRRRPMDRIVMPLLEMGVAIEAREGRFAPLTVEGGCVHGYHYEMPVASAQVKSAVLLAGLYADGPVEVVEPAVCRDHTEIMLAHSGARIEKEGTLTRIFPATDLELGEVDIPGDFSSAAFFLVAATVIPGSEVTLTGVGVNPTRTGLLDIMLQMGADIKIENQRFAGGEPVADLVVRSAALKGIEVDADISGRAIDELPLVALLGAFAQGGTVVRGAAELKVKESDRIDGLVASMTAGGVDIEVRDDGFSVQGGGVTGGRFESRGDHRMAMLGAIAGAASRDGVEVAGFDCVEVSFPNFLEVMESLGGSVQ